MSGGLWDILDPDGRGVSHRFSKPVLDKLSFGGRQGRAPSGRPVGGPVSGECSETSAPLSRCRRAPELTLQAETSPSEGDPAGPGEV